MKFETAGVQNPHNPVLYWSQLSIHFSGFLAAVSYEFLVLISKCASASQVFKV